MFEGIVFNTNKFFKGGDVIGRVLINKTWYDIIPMNSKNNKAGYASVRFINSNSMFYEETTSKNPTITIGDDVIYFVWRGRTELYMGMM